MAGNLVFGYIHRGWFQKQEILSNVVLITSVITTL